MDAQEEVPSNPADTSTQVEELQESAVGKEVELPKQMRQRKTINLWWFFAIYVAWALTGLFFWAYAPKANFGLARSVYQVVNVGYGIGWGLPIDNCDDCKIDPSYAWFAMAYILFAASMVGVALSIFADRVSQHRESWFSEWQEQEEMAKRTDLKKYWDMYGSTVMPFFIVFLYQFAMICYLMVDLDYNLRDAVFYSLSSYLTAGITNIPDESPTQAFAIIGTLILTGVPFVGVALGTLGTFLMGKLVRDKDEETDVQKILSAPMTDDETARLTAWGLDPSTKNSFILVGLLRMGSDPVSVEYLMQRFKDASA